MTKAELQNALDTANGELAHAHAIIEQLKAERETLNGRLVKAAAWYREHTPKTKPCNRVGCDNGIYSWAIPGGSASGKCWRCNGTGRMAA